ncbi:MAG: HAD family hydrolase [Bacteroidales bacterium]
MQKAVIFDMDGVIVNNHHYHVKAWREFCAKKNIPFNEQEFRKRYFGKNNHDILSGLLNKDVSDNDVISLGEAKEALYREIYQPHIKPVEGLEELLKALKDAGMSLAVATSARKPNLDFVVKSLKIEHYFDVMVDASMVKKSKPDPEIFLKSAFQMDVEPHDCIVFEDSVSGINAAKAAGMRVVALLTTHNREELPDAPLFVKDFTDRNLSNFLNINL